MLVGIVMLMVGCGGIASVAYVRPHRYPCCPTFTVLTGNLFIAGAEVFKRDRIAGAEDARGLHPNRALLHVCPVIFFWRESPTRNAASTRPLPEC